MIERVTRLIKVLTLMSAVVALPADFDSEPGNVSPHEKDGWKMYGFDSKCVMCHTRNKLQKLAVSPGPNKTESILPALELSGERPSLNGANSFPSSNFYGLKSDDPSMMCLACHDGIIAKSVGISIRDSFTARHNQGGSHPIGVDYYESKMNRQGAGLKDPRNTFPGNPKNVRVSDVLWKSRIVTCTSCHDPHGLNSVDVPPGTTNYHLYGPQKRSLICAGCHDQGGN
jgi:cytochrome c553